MSADIDLLARLCPALDVKIAVAESLTSGMLASTIGRGLNAKDWSAGGSSPTATRSKPEDGHPPGTVYLGWATADGDGALSLNLTGPPEAVLARTVDEAVTLLAELTTRVTINEPRPMPAEHDQGSTCAARSPCRVVVRPIIPIRGARRAPG